MSVKSIATTLVSRVIPLVLGLAGLTLVILWLYGAFITKIAPGRQPATARHLGTQPTDVVHEVTKDYIEESIGTLKAANRTVISAKLLETIDEITVTAGDTVAPGDVLVRLDRKALEARVRQVQNSLKAAEARLREAIAEHRRVASLVKQKVVSRSEYDTAKAKHEVALATKSRLEAAVREANVRLSYTTIRAPKGGRIVDRLAEPGDTAKPAEPLLVLYDAASLRLEAPVVGKLAVKLRVGQRLVVYVDALDRKFEATIDEIVPQADAPSRSFLVKASVPRSDDLYEGMFGRLLVPAGERRHLCLAIDAIQEIGQLKFVDVILPDDTLERRLIKTGRLGIPGRVEVLSGLRAGERIVLRPTGDASGDAAAGVDR